MLMLWGVIGTNLRSKAGHSRLSSSYPEGMLSSFLAPTHVQAIPDVVVASVLFMPLLFSPPPPYVKVGGLVA